MRRWRTWIIAAALFVAAFVAALLFLDRPVSDWVDRAPLFDPKRNSAWKIPKRAGEFQYILPVIAAVAIWHRRRWRGAVMLLIASAFAGVAYSLLKWSVGRRRPSVDLGPYAFEPFTGGIPGIVTSGNLSFPSGHATFAFAVAAGMTILLPRWGWAFFLLALACGAQRVLERAHHPSDIIASAAIGVLSAVLADRLARRFFPQPESGPADTGTRDPHRATLA